MLAKQSIDAKMIDPTRTALLSMDLQAGIVSIYTKDDQIVIIKHRVSAFTGTDLDLILRANNIDTLILLGIATSGVVLSTALDASDADYQIVVVGDCCADLDHELHTSILEKLLPQRGRVVKSADLIAES